MSRILKLIVLLVIYTQPLVSTGQDLTRMNRGELRDLAIQLQKVNDEYNSKILSLLETEALLKRNIQSLASENGYQLENITNLNNQVIDQQTQLRQYESQLNEMRRELIHFNLIVDSLTNESVSLYSMVQSLRDSLAMVLERGVVHGEGSPCGTSISDIEANTYKTVQIGDQCWMAENLRTSKYQNGDPIPNVTDKTEWSSNWPIGSWSHYNNDSQNELVYGKLYNFNSMNDTRGICPVGWHVPSDSEWSTMHDFLSTDNGHKLKAGSFNGSNSSGFNAVAGGHRDYFGEFIGLGTEGHMWSTSQPSAQSAWVRVLRYDSRDMDTDTPDLFTGISIRCLRD